MEDRSILHAIVQADQSARKRVDAAGRREKLLSGSFHEIQSAAEKKAMAAARQETEALRAQTEHTTAQRLARLDREQTDALAALDRVFEGKKDDCVERIFQMTVGLS